MDLKLKIEIAKHIEDTDLINQIDDGEICNAKLTSNRKVFDTKRDNDNVIISIRSIKVIIEVVEGCVILFGNLNASFKHPMGGELYVTKVIYDPACDFNNTKGVETSIEFSNTPTNLDTMFIHLKNILYDEDFVFNITQFDEFMEIFEYYKKLSDELNNNASYLIEKKSEPYLFIPVNVKELLGLDGELLPEYKGLEEVRDSNDIIRGYYVEEYTYELMPNIIKDEVIDLIDIEITNSGKIYNQVIKMIDNLYMSNFQIVSQKDTRDLIHINVLNVLKSKKNIVLSIENNKDLEGKYLNLYDMGQKIKVDSIEESLRLIHQGNSGSAIELISYLIGDSEMPNVNNKPINIDKYTKELNIYQKEAFVKAIDGSPVTLIKGPPGTGKTHVINAITQYITKELKEKVVISSQTHVAIDNVLDKLMENYDLVVPNRITNKMMNPYSGNNIDTTLYKTWGKKIKNHLALSSNENLTEAILSDLENFKGHERISFSNNTDITEYSVLGATTTTSEIAGKKGLSLLKEYNWLIIDEVSKCPITEVLRYLPYIDRIIMVGDDYQLSPLLEFSKEEVCELPSYDEDMFERLKEIYQKSVFAGTMEKAIKANRLVELNINYRSVPTVLRAYNIFYDYSLESERLNVKPNKVSFTEQLDYLNDNDIVFVFVKGGKEIYVERSKSRYNVEEMEATKYMLAKLIKETKNAKNIKVAAIFPYGEQISRFMKENKDLINKAKLIFKEFEIDTVDAFQGKESDIVLVNTVITERNKKNFLKDFRRINVSMSRAKDKLIIFGNKLTLEALDMDAKDGTSRKYFKEILKDISRFGLNMEYTNQGGVKVENTSKNKTKIKKTVK